MNMFGLFSHENDRKHNLLQMFHNLNQISQMTQSHTFGGGATFSKKIKILSKQKKKRLWLIFDVKNWKRRIFQIFHDLNKRF